VATSPSLPQKLLYLRFSMIAVCLRAIRKQYRTEADYHSLLGRKTFRLADRSRSSQMITALIRFGFQPSCKVETPPGKGRQLSMRMAGLLQTHKQTK
jgi:hypothetical protein